MDALTIDVQNYIISLLSDIDLKIIKNKLNYDLSELFLSAEVGYVNILDIIHNTIYVGGNPYKKANNIIVSTAMNCSYINILQWAQMKGYKFTYDSCIRAIMIGNLDILHWLVSNGCILEDETYLLAVRSGNLDILQYLIAAGYNCDIKRCISEIQYVCYYKTSTDNKQLMHKYSIMITWLTKQ